MLEECVQKMNGKMNTAHSFGKHLLVLGMIIGLACTASAAMVLPATNPEKDAFTRSFHWNFAGCAYAMDYTFPWETYHFYQEKPRVFRNYAVYTYENRQHSFLADFVQTLECKAEYAGLDREETLGFVIAFVQQLEYRNDQGEYPKFPIETIAEFGGDCEDTSILLAAMLREMGYETILINPPGHMAIAMALKGEHGEAFHWHGRDYYYVETTASGFGVGDIPENYKDKSGKLMAMSASSDDLWVLHAFVPRRAETGDMLYYVSEDEGLIAQSQRGQSVVAKATVRRVAIDGTVSTSRSLRLTR